MRSRTSGIAQIAVLILFLGVMAVVAQTFSGASTIGESVDASLVATQPTQASEDCTPLNGAVEMGHGEMWKLHHNCK